MFRFYPFRSGSHVAVFLVFCMGLQAYTQESGIHIKWDEGLRLSNSDHSFNTKFGGRIMYDLAGFDQSIGLQRVFGIVRPSTEFRRVRAFNSGQFGRIKYKVQFEFAKERVEIKDLYVEIGDLPVVGQIRVGHFKEPFLLEALTSSKYTTFMERALPAMFSSSRNVGLMCHDQIPGTAFYWQFGLFHTEEEKRLTFNMSKGLSAIGRVSGLVLRDTERQRAMHVGLGIKRSSLRDHTYHMSTRPESHLAPKYVSTGHIEGVRNLTYASAEAMLLLASFSLQGEYAQTYVNVVPETPGASTHIFHAFYTQASYLLTGETRNFKDSNKGFGRIRPHRNAGKHGFGAWEVALRYSRASLNHQNVSGGSMSNVSFGLNWYLNTQARILLNYVLSEVGTMGNTAIYQTRFQVEF